MSSFSNIYTLLARDATTDMSDRMTTLHKLIDIFTFEYDTTQLDREGKHLGQEPIVFQMQPFTVATSWYSKSKLRADTPLKFRIVVIAPNGTEMNGVEQIQTIPKGFKRFSANFILDALPVIARGEYSLRVDLLSENGSKLTSGSCIYEVSLNEK